MPKSKAPGTALAKWSEKLAALAKSAKTQEAMVGAGANFISLRGGNMSYQKGMIPGNVIKCIVLDAIAEKQFYSAKFDENNPSSPDCYAFGHDPDALAPDPENVEAPVSADCASCPNNEWGSADTGKGKACQDVRRLALITEGDLQEIETAQVAYLKVPVTSLSYWAGYVRDLEAVHHKPPLAFVTEISVKPQQRLPGWHVEFRMADEIDDPAIFELLMEKYEKVSREIAFPYPKLTQIEGNGKPAKAAPKKAQRREVVAPVATAAPASSSSRVTVGARKPVKQPKY
jgi:hypothetical protein